MFSVCLFTGGVPPGVPPKLGGAPRGTPQLGGVPLGVPPSKLGGPQGVPPNWGGTPGGTPHKFGQKCWTKFGTKNGQSFGQYFGQKIGQTFWKLLEVGWRGRYDFSGHAGGLSCGHNMYNVGFLQIASIEEIEMCVN